MPAGRKTKYTPERVKRIIDALAAGASRRLAAQYGGIDDATICDWMNKHVEFSDAVKKAESDAELAHIANIRKVAISGEWTASAWWLERRRPQDWGKVERVEVTLRHAAEKLAGELGMSVDDVLAEADRLVSGGSR